DALRIGESCLRWWSNAAALAASGAPVHLVGVTGPVARALATWNQAGYARSELAARAPLLMPPTVRVAAVTGAPQAVERALSDVRTAVPTLPPAAVLGPVRLEDDPATMRALVRFEYGEGRPATEALRAAVVREALRGGRGRGGGRTRNTLRVRVDVPDPELRGDPVRLGLAGTADAAVPPLRRLAASAHEIALVVTRPDAPVGRRRVMTPSPVAQAASELGLDVLRTTRLDESASARVAAADPG